MLFYARNLQGFRKPWSFFSAAGEAANKIRFAHKGFAAGLIFVTFARQIFMKRPF
jgi:hypothetical protein